MKIPICPDCGRDWSKRLPPFRDLNCRACATHKQAAIDYIGARQIAKLKPLPVLTPEQRHAKAKADMEMLYGKE